MNATLPETTTLATGQRMDRATFHARYLDTPEHCKAELIDGVVFVASPISKYHCDANDDLTLLFRLYAASTSGAHANANITCIVDDETEVQPDAAVWIHSECGGRCRIKSGYIMGSPELVVEVAYTTVDRDLKTKRKLYEDHGVQEYLVYRADIEELIWFRRDGDGFVRHNPDDDGVYRSVAFPGLQLRVEELIASNVVGLMATLQLGLASQAHADFVESLAQRRRPS